MRRAPHRHRMPAVEGAGRLLPEPGKDQSTVVIFIPIGGGARETDSSWALFPGGRDEQRCDDAAPLIGFVLLVAVAATPRIGRWLSVLIVRDPERMRLSVFLIVVIAVAATAVGGMISVRLLRRRRFRCPGSYCFCPLQSSSKDWRVQLPFVLPLFTVHGHGVCSE